MCVSVGASAQVLQVTSTEQVPIPASPDAKVAAISPQGDYLLLTTDVDQGLTKFDLTTHAVTTITTATGAGYDARISPDGKQVVYREKSFDQSHLSYTSLHAMSLATGAKQELVAATRDLQGVAVQSGTVAAINGGSLRAKAMGQAQAQVTAPVFSIDNRNLMITEGGETRKFNPNGDDQSYLWPSLSPDGQCVLYFVAGEGTFVCNLDGSSKVSLGLLRAPQWLGNDIVVGMQDEDDGMYITASRLVASDLSGTQQVLTSQDVIAMWPQVSAASGKIAFSTPAGQAYIINVEPLK